MDKLATVGVMGAKTSYMQQFQATLADRGGGGCRVTKKGWGEAAHWNVETLLHTVHQ